MFLVKEKPSLDNRVGRFAVTIFFIVLAYFLIGIAMDVLRMLE